MQERIRVAVVLELSKGHGDIPGLRRWLKMVLRAYGLKCIAINHSEPEQSVDCRNQPISKEC